MTLANLAARLGIVLVWIIMFGIAFSLPGCKTAPIVVDKAKPPVDLMEPCAHPFIRAKKNSDLVDAIIAYRGALNLCNNDKAALREWAKD